MSNKEKVYDILKQLYRNNKKGVTAEVIAKELNISRANTSNYLNQLCKEALVQKIKSRPVYFIPMDEFNREGTNYSEDCFSSLIGKSHSLQKVVEKAKASILYPPYGLHSIIYGETGVGKSMLARYMYEFSIECGVRSKEAAFVTFNCADYASNPQLLMGHIFGVEKGAYTGAQNSKKGLLEVAHEGILFLDEVHRLPPEGQEMLFTFIDTGVFKRMGQSSKEIKSEVLIIAATTENPESTLLDTFNRRIPMVIEIPPLRERSLVERIELVKYFLKKEALRVNKPIKIHRQIMKSLLLYECKNNVGQLQNDIRLSVANAYLNHIKNSSEFLELNLSYFNNSLDKIKSNYRGKAYEVDILVPKDIDYYMFYPSGKEENFGFRELQKRDEDDKDRAELSLFREGIVENALIDKLFMDTKFFNLCQDIKEIIENELSIVLSEKRFYHMSIFINSIIHNNLLNNNSNKLDINEIRQKNKEEFKVALKIVNIIESELNIFLSIEDAAYIAIFLSKDIKEEHKEIDHKVSIIVAMHGDSTASSMVKVVKDILGQGSIYSFDMKLNESYKKVIKQFKETIKNVKAEEGVLLLTDMGSLNGFDKIIKEQLNVEVKTIPMVTTLIVLEAMQKLNVGFSLIEVYNSIMEIMTKGVMSELINKHKENIIIIGYNISEGIDKESKNIIKQNLSSYIQGIDIVFIPHENEQNFFIGVNKILEEKNVIAVIDNYSLNIDGVEHLTKEQLKSQEGIEQLRDIIKINRGYSDICEGLKSSLNYTSYSKVLEDVKVTINNLLKAFNIKKQYDMVIGLAMHLSFMIDNLVGNTRILNKFSRDKIEKNADKISIIKSQMNLLEKNYKIEIDENECYGILCVLSDAIEIKNK